MQTLICAIVVDEYGAMGRNGSEEAKIIKTRVRRALRGVAKVTFKTPKVMSSDLVADLLVFDYGGMQTKLYDYSRKVVQWMVDHPSSLVVIGSSFSYDVAIRRELDVAGYEDVQLSSNYRDDSYITPNMMLGFIAFPLLGTRKYPERLMKVEQEIRKFFATPSK